MFACCKKTKTKVEGSQVIMRREDLVRASLSAEARPLTLENLPWQPPETRVPEEVPFVTRKVINMVVCRSLKRRLTSLETICICECNRDPYLYRPRAVHMRESSVWTINKYITDLNRHPQHTVGDMEKILNYPQSSKQTDQCLWLDILLSNQPTCCQKIPTPFKRNALHEIADMIRLPGKALQSNKNLRPLDVRKPESNIDIILQKLFRMQVEMNVYLLNSGYDNCYVQMMRMGDDEGVDLKAINKQQASNEIGMDQPKEDTRYVTDKKRIQKYLEKLQRRKLKRKMEEIYAEPCGGNYEEYSSVYTESIEEEYSSDVCIENIPNEEDDNVEVIKTKKRRGLVSRLTSPFRWLRKKLCPCKDSKVDD